MKKHTILVSIAILLVSMLLMSDTSHRRKRSTDAEREKIGEHLADILKENAMIFSIIAQLQTYLLEDGTTLMEGEQGSFFRNASREELQSYATIVKDSVECLRSCREHIRKNMRSLDSCKVNSKISV